jgi:hypothetical protein
MKKEHIKSLIKSGSFDTFLEMAEELANNIQVEFRKDPYELAFEHGKRQGVLDLLELIKSEANNIING